MTEEEKIFAGRLFDARTKELRDIKHKAHVLCQKFNLMDEYDEDRLPIIREFIGGIGQHFYFQGPIQFNYGCHTFIGDNFFANFNTTVMDDGRIYIGDKRHSWQLFGCRCSLQTGQIHHGKGFKEVPVVKLGQKRYATIELLINN